MRYLRKFRGDEITENDLMPITLESLSLDIPQMGPQFTEQSKNRLDQLPIRVKTRFRGGISTPRRRVVSTPIFDLVTPTPGMGLLPPPTIVDRPSHTTPRPLSKASRELPPVPKKDSGNSKYVPGSRQVSMPVQYDLNIIHEHNKSVESYTSIIEIYRKNAPFENLNHSSHIHNQSLTPSSHSSPEADASSTSSGSEYSFEDADEVITSVFSHSPQSSISMGNSLTPDRKSVSHMSPDQSPPYMNSPSYSPQRHPRHPVISSRMAHHGPFTPISQDTKTPSNITGNFQVRHLPQLPVSRGNRPPTQTNEGGSISHPVPTRLYAN